MESDIQRNREIGHPPGRAQLALPGGCFPVGGRDGKAENLRFIIVKILTKAYN
jgi:hypothetical protein